MQLVIVLIAIVWAFNANAAPCEGGNVDNAVRLAVSASYDRENLEETYAAINNAYKTMFGSRCDVKADISGIDVTDKTTGNKTHIDLAVISGSIYELLSPPVMNKALAMAQKELLAMQFAGMKGQFKHIQINGLPD